MIGLTLEALLDPGVAREVRRQHLDGDLPPQPRVSGSVHLPHASRADRSEDLVPSQPRSRRQRHRFM